MTTSSFKSLTTILFYCSTSIVLKNTRMGSTRLECACTFYSQRLPSDPLSPKQSKLTNGETLSGRSNFSLSLLLNGPPLLSKQNLTKPLACSSWVGSKTPTHCSTICYLAPQRLLKATIADFTTINPSASCNWAITCNVSPPARST